MRSTLCLFFAIICVVLGLSSTRFFFIEKPSPSQKNWPHIANFDATILINCKSERIGFRLPLHDLQGKTVYTLFCSGGSEEYLDRLSDTTGIDHVGAFALRLVEGTTDSDESLLTEDGSPYWYSRGRVLYEELLGAYGRYPEYGVLRHFRLRGFELTLHFVDIHTDTNGKIEWMNLHISVRPCPECKKSRAQRPGYITPHKVGRNPEIILKGNEPLIRRGENGSWEEYKDEDDQ